MECYVCGEKATSEGLCKKHHDYSLIGCPKCASPAYYGDSGSFWTPPANRCFICGLHRELPMYSKRIDLKEVAANNSKYFRDCASGCGTRISVNTKSDLCKQCRQKLKAKLTIESAQKKLDELEAV